MCVSRNGRRVTEDDLQIQMSQIIYSENNTTPLAPVQLSLVPIILWRSLGGMFQEECARRSFGRSGSRRRLFTHYEFGRRQELLPYSPS